PQGARRRHAHRRCAQGHARRARRLLLLRQRIPLFRPRARAAGRGRRLPRPSLPGLARFQGRQGRRHLYRPPAGAGVAGGGRLLSLAVAALPRRSRCAALVASAATPFALWLLGDRPETVLFALLTLLLWIMHHANIARLLNGTEGKIGASSGA